MKWENDTSWQHFIPQVEQRFNAINPQAPKDKQKIYQFEIANREALELRLVSPQGKKILNNLAHQDLFSFDVELDKKFRHNFEDVFQHYESQVKTHTDNLIHKLETGQSVNEEVVNLFCAKLLNFIRNPFSIHKVLNTFGNLTNYVPAMPEHQQIFERVLTGRKPHQEYLCTQFGITDAEYQKWLGMLFMLVLPSGGGEMNMLESIVKGMFVSNEAEICVLVSLYSEASCLLSDRAFSTNTDRAGVDGFDFNLSSKSFIRYLFADIDAIAPTHASPEYLESYKDALKRQPLPRTIQLYREKDNEELLRGFNRNVIYQSHSHVYCSVKSPLV
jgi:hypothetical protein